MQSRCNLVLWMQSSGSLVPSLVPRLSVGGERREIKSMHKQCMDTRLSSFPTYQELGYKAYLVPCRAVVALFLAEQWYSLVLRLYLMFRMRA